MARPKMSLRISSVLAMAGALLAASPALAGAGIDVIMNQAKIVKIARPADTIVVGNPEIADASVQDATTIVLTGKGFGVTNLVILDSEGSPIVDEQVIVSRSYRRSDVQTLSCTPYCEGSYKSDAERTSEAELNSSQ